MPLLRALDESLITERYGNLLPSIGRWKINLNLSLSELDCVSHNYLLWKRITLKNTFIFAFKEIEKCNIIIIFYFFLQSIVKKRKDWETSQRAQDRTPNSCVRHFTLW